MKIEQVCAREITSQPRWAAAIHLIVCGLFAWIALGLATEAWALTEEQQTKLRQAEAAIQRAQADINAARGSAGTSANPARGSQLRLTRMRLDSALEQLAQADRVLSELPSDDDAVKVSRSRHAAARADVVEIETIIQPAPPVEAAPASQPTEREAIKMEDYPKFEEDFALLQALARRYGNFQAAVEQPQVLAQVVREDGQVLAEIQRIARTYLPLVEQKTAEGIRIERMFDHFQTQRNQFAAELMPYRNALPAAIEADLTEADRLADHAVQTNRPAFFGPEGGITQRFGFAEDKLFVLRAFGEEASEPSARALDEARHRIKQRADALKQEIINATPLPADSFAGSDRDAIIARAKDAWAHQQKDAPILTARIPSQAWERSTSWEWFNGAFHKVDVSRIQVQLVIRHDDRLAVIQPINIRKNHLKNDALTGHPLFAADEELPPQQFMLLEKVK